MVDVEVCLCQNPNPTAYLENVERLDAIVNRKGATDDECRERARVYRDSTESPAQKSPTVIANKKGGRVVSPIIVANSPDDLSLRKHCIREILLKLTKRLTISTERTQAFLCLGVSVSRCVCVYLFGCETLSLCVCVCVG